jgi:hypothetical protein
MDANSFRELAEKVMKKANKRQESVEGKAGNFRLDSFDI